MTEPLTWVLEHLRDPIDGSGFLAPETETAVMSVSGSCYPVVEGIPILMDAEDWQEFVTATDEEEYSGESRFRAALTPFSEVNALDELVALSPDFRGQRRAYEFLMPKSGGLCLQVGGSGGHAVNFLKAGAKRSVLVTPFLAEAHWADKLAQSAGYGDRFQAVVAVAERLPFAAETFTAAYSGGCIHHTDTLRSGIEIERVLSKGGRFASVDHYSTPLYWVGRRVIGQRERGVDCRPLNDSRVRDLQEGLTGAETRRLSPVVRYATALLAKFGWRIPRSIVRFCFDLEALVCSRGLDGRFGSAVVVTYAKP